MTYFSNQSDSIEANTAEHNCVQKLRLDNHLNVDLDDGMIADTPPACINSTPENIELESDQLSTSSIFRINRLVISD